MGKPLPPMPLSFSVRANENQEARLGHLFYFPGRVRVTAVSVKLAEPLETGKVKLNGTLWVYDRKISEFLAKGHQAFLNEIGPGESLRAASNKVSFGDTQEEFDKAISTFPIKGNAAGNVFVTEIALGNYAPASLVRGRLSIRIESIDPEEVKAGAGG